MDKTYELPELHSRFAEFIVSFVRLKRGEGFKYNTEARLLARLDRFCHEKHPDEPFDRRLVDDWTGRKGYERFRTQVGRIFLAGQFARYLRAHGVDAYVPPPLSRVRSKMHSYVPHIYTDRELSALFAAADSWERTAVSPRLHLMLGVFLRLLYSCGLRLREALDLKVGDVDLDRCVLSVFNGKFHKSRYVPFGESLRKRLLDYKTKAGMGKDGDAPFFSPPHGGCYSNSTIQSHFRKLLWKAGMSFGGRGKGPRIHDFRHTFAVRRLLKWSEEDRDLNVLYPYLSAYLGHESLSSTQHYLRLTVDAFPLIARKTQRLSSQIIPRIDTWEVQDADN